MSPAGATAPARAIDRSLHLRVLGQHVWLLCDDARLAGILAENFSLLRSAETGRAPDLRYFAERCVDGGIAVSRDHRPLGVAADAGDALFLVEQDLRMELQLRRPDLLFLHAAALTWKGRACLLAGESGAGKSTTTWALLQHGLAYLSDEMSPVEPQSLSVHAYPHALCMKRRPPDGYPLPPSTMDLGATLHLPAHRLPNADARDTAHPLAAIFFVSHRSTCPVAQRLTAGEVAARLYVVALNALSHRHAGLEAVARIAERIPGYAIGTARLAAACDAIHGVVRRAASAHAIVEGGPMVAAKPRLHHPL